MRSVVPLVAARAALSLVALVALVGCRRGPPPPDPGTSGATPTSLRGARERTALDTLAVEIAAARVRLAAGRDALFACAAADVAAADLSDSEHPSAIFALVEYRLVCGRDVPVAALTAALRVVEADVAGGPRPVATRNACDAARRAAGRLSPDGADDTIRELLARLDTTCPLPR